jgi:hypothetical protein
MSVKQQQVDRDKNTSKLIKITNPKILKNYLSLFRILGLTSHGARGNVLVQGARGLGFKSQSRQDEL